MKRFNLPCDLHEAMNPLPDQYAGQIFKMILNHVNDLPLDNDDPVMNALFNAVSIRFDKPRKKVVLVKETLEQRKLIFKKKVVGDLQANYSVPLMKDFFEYWSEHGEDDNKMRFEKERTFGLKRRMSTFSKNDFKKVDKSNEKPVIPSWNKKD